MPLVLILEHVVDKVGHRVPEAGIEDNVLAYDQAPAPVVAGEIAGRPWPHRTQRAATDCPEFAG